MKNTATPIALGTTVQYEVKLNDQWVTLEGTLIGFHRNGWATNMEIAKDLHSGLKTYVDIDNIVSHELPVIYATANKYFADDLNHATCY